MNAIESVLGKRPVLESYTLESYDGVLCVAYKYSMQNEPKVITVYWPTNARVAMFVRDYGDRIGETVEHNYGEFTLRPQDSWGHHVTIQLVDGGRTKPVYTLELNYDCPKVRKGTETEYRNGRWYKLLKRGWTEA